MPSARPSLSKSGSRSTALPASSTPLPLRPSRTRKTQSSSPRINTNVNAHPRTDPLSALSVLLKLISSLPSRLGGCQYKLTQPEHALCLHLLGVLDPFVYQGIRALSPPSSGSSRPALLIQQPTEILDAILSHVDSKKDLLSIGLGCKRLWDVVFPRHWEYRVIRCKVSSISVWNHLVKHRSLARNVRRLEIIDERTPGLGTTSSSRSVSFSPSSTTPGMLVPKGVLQTDTDLDSTDSDSLSPLSIYLKHEKFFCAALSRMTGLKELRWSCNHSPISITNPGVWNTLARVSVGGLKEMVVVDNLVFSPGVGMEEEESSTEEESGDDSEEGGRLTVATNGVATREVPQTRARAIVLSDMESIVFRSTSHSYGAPKQPELKGITAMLHQCVNLKNLEITYIPPRSTSSSPPLGHGGALVVPGAGASNSSRPWADEFLLYSRWTNLTTLILTNLRCTSSLAPSSFLSAHQAIEVLHLDISIHGGGGGGGGGSTPIYLQDGALPRLKEVRASKEVINAILECPCPSASGAPGKRPLEVIKGFRLSGNHPSSLANQNANSSSSRSVPDSVFLSNLRHVGSCIRRVELAGWHDMEDIRKIAGCVPNIQWLDVGRRFGSSGAGAAHRSTSEKGVSAGGPVTNMVEWAEVLATLPDLVSMHGVRFFYEVSNAAIASTAPVTVSPPANNNIGPIHYHTNNNVSWSDITTSAAQSLLPSSNKIVHPSSSASASMSMMERSRMRKNDEIAGVLAWKCRKLRRVDHWEEGGGKVVVLLRDEGGHGKDKEREGKVRWEVRRIKH